MQELSGAKKQYANIIRIDDLVRRETYPSVERRAELYDRGEGGALANRIQLATCINSMQFALGRRQEDFEDILFGSLKDGRLVNVSSVDREAYNCSLLNGEFCHFYGKKLGFFIGVRSQEIVLIPISYLLRTRFPRNPRREKRGTLVPSKSVWQCKHVDSQVG